MRSLRLGTLFLLLTCSILGLAKVHSIADDTISPSEVLRHPDLYDNHHVIVFGAVGNVQEKTSHKGNAYDIFEICDTRCVKVFAWGHPALVEGQKVKVRGTFSALKRVGGYTFRDEIDADDNSL